MLREGTSVSMVARTQHSIRRPNCQLHSMPEGTDTATGTTPFPDPFPELPRQKVGADLFEWKGTKYLLVVDYFSRFIEIARIIGKSSADKMQHMKSIQACHESPR